MFSHPHLDLGYECPTFSTTVVIEGMKEAAGILGTAEVTDHSGTEELPNPSVELPVDQTTRSVPCSVALRNDNDYSGNLFMIFLSPCRQL
jgi:hypothetical protein